MSKDGISAASASQQAALYGTHQATIDRLLKERTTVLELLQIALPAIIEQGDRSEKMLMKLVQWVETARRAKGEA
jgi:hypothetical protein